MRFLSSTTIIIRVPFFLLFGFEKGPKKKKGKRVLLGNLVMSVTAIRNASHSLHLSIVVAYQMNLLN